jgi:DNA invertase Pin-like site-specific DNA recombinase
MSTPATRRVVILGRVSTTDKGQDTGTQLAALREAAARQGWEVVGEIALELSVWSDKEAAEVRRRALAPVREGRADTLMVWALDRVTRRGIEAALSLLREIEEHLVRQRPPRRSRYHGDDGGRRSPIRRTVGNVHPCPADSRRAY